MIRSIFNELQTHLSIVGPVVIAGGAVRDSLMGVTPKDYDIFVFCEEAASSRIAYQMDAAGYEKLEVPEYHKSEPFLTGTWRVLGQVVQVMWTPSKTVADLVASFDWNTCLFAFNGEFLQFESIDNIGPGKSLRLQKITFPISSLRRGYRFSERFGMKLERKDLFALCRAVLELEKDGQP